MQTFKQKLNNIKAFAFDVDGVLSGGVVIQPEGGVMRTMNAKDGYALQLAHKLGYPIAIITGASSEAIAKRFEALGITDIYLKSASKIKDFEDFIMRYELSTDQVLYMGDDIPDYQIMEKTGVATCPSDAAPEIKSISHYISDIPGGQGCVRDVLEQTLKVQNKWLTGEAFEW